MAHCNIEQSDPSEYGFNGIGRHVAGVEGQDAKEEARETDEITDQSNRLRGHFCISRQTAMASWYLFRTRNRTPNIMSHSERVPAQNEW